MEQKILSYIKTLSEQENIQKILLEVLGKILSKQKNIDNFLKENNIKIIHIRDWIISVVENKEQWKTPRVLTIDALYNFSNKYFEKKNNKLTTIELNEKDEKLIADLGDYYVVQMLTSDSLDNESIQMQHCIGHGGYDEKIKNHDYQYLSLRDKYNKAHVTLEIYNDVVLQLQGKQNKLPDKKYLEKIIPWLIYNKKDIKLDNYGLLLNKNDNKIYSKYNIPNDSYILDNLSFLNKDNLIFPEKMTLDGALILYNCEGIKLSTELNASDLRLSKCSITELPKNITIKNDIDLSFSTIEQLPDNFIVNKNLYLSYCQKLKKLPKNLNVNKDLYLEGTEIKEIPNDIKIGNNLYIDYSKIKKLPKNLSCNNLNISFLQIDLIKESMNFNNIIINEKTKYTKKEFFEKYKKDENIIDKIKNIFI